MATRQNNYPRGSGFVGLRDYLGLNSSNRMGSDLAGELEEAGRPLARSIQDAGAEFYDRATRGTPTYQAGQAESMGAEANAGRVVYQGPNTLGDVANVGRLEEETDRVSQLAQMAGTDAGRAALFRQRYGDKGTYTDGGAALDGAIAGRTGGARLASAASNFARLREMLGVAQQGASTQASQGRNAAEELAARYRREAPPPKPPAPPSMRPLQPGTPGMVQERADLDAPRRKKKRTDPDNWADPDLGGG